MSADAAAQKRAAAEAAARLVEPGMRLGLGTGSTAAEFVAILGSLVRDGLDIVGVPTSEATAEQARSLGIPLGELDDFAPLDLTVDGADEIGPGLALIKGGGGALLREKIVARSSRRMVVIADASKRVATLGAFPLPVEIVRFGAMTTVRRIADVLGDCGIVAGVALRLGSTGKPFVSDGGNFIADCACRRIADPARLAAAVSSVTGVVEHGLFIAIASTAFVAGPDGRAVTMESPS